ncbi:predicted protein [Sclerotinia sclerotiorum 1980 UF-70]|uniref:Uncharacterized protein n=1 Tax=Sclerotinia sclerotiorum (strain ATCC 18683 / 1980 / Ss-1) TaxID=665079 RepID=A7EZJ2_SCLS1|nr:predicted protein [Sclerotinia sclerotiorum 1980 UF-70]EDN94884.1 predicted protein [Sclerotinia sclerotiorum 1980 UF-70]
MASLPPYPLTANGKEDRCYRRMHCYFLATFREASAATKMKNFKPLVG